MAGVFKPHHFADYGKLSLAFVMLWAYFNFSQDLFVRREPAEDPVFRSPALRRWQYLALCLVLFQFAVPFALLLSRDRNARRRSSSWWRSGSCSCASPTCSCSSRQFDSSGPNLHVLAGEHTMCRSSIGWIWRRRLPSAASGSGFLHPASPAAAAADWGSVPSPGARKHRRPLMSEHAQHHDIAGHRSA